MSNHGQLVSLVLMIGLSVAMVTACVLVHYETLRMASMLMPRLTIQPRKRILFVMGAAFIAHTTEVWLIAGMYYFLGQVLGLGGIAGRFGGTFYEYLYFAVVAYTSLGLGDLYPTGDLRILTGVTAMIGLSMTAWTGSFTYLAMEKFWSLHRTSTD